MESMNLDLKAVYFCSTSQRNWGKGYTIQEAMHNAHVLSFKPKFDFYVQAALFNNPSEEELKNLHDCITADQTFGNPTYYTLNRTPEDEEMIKKYHVGWITVFKTPGVK